MIFAMATFGALVVQVGGLGLIELSIKLITIVLSNYELPLVIYQRAT